jgi:leucyl-tRNA---protein transferase
VTRLSELKLYATHPHPCSYLPNQDATTLFIDPQAKLDRSLYSQLSDLGFRRSGDHIYRPRCEHCAACIPVRLPVQEFRANRKQKRCWTRNQDLHVTVTQQLNSELHYPLYAEYISGRHSDGDMYPPSQDQFQSFLKPAWQSTDYLEFWLGQDLLGVAVSDRLEQGLSAIYTFYSPDPAHQQRSLGVFAVLYQIYRAHHLDLDYVYLGYWVNGCRKMAYKNEYQPQELLIEQHWQRGSHTG